MSETAMTTQDSLIGGTSIAAENQNPTALAKTANEAHELAAKCAMEAVHHWIVAGTALLQAKTKVPHGEWLAWLTENCPRIGERTCQLYMQAARYKETFELKAKYVSHLTFSNII